VRPKLTIVTPSLNQAAFLERTLRSVLDQGYENLEYMIVDGGSTDGSVEIIERYAERLAWWVSEPDDGQTDALNKGLRRATGEIVAYINSDDYYLPGAFYAAVEAFTHTGARWVAGAARFVDEQDNVTEVWRAELPTTPRHRWVLDPVGWPQPASFWRRDLFDEFGHFREDLHYVFDTEFGLRLALADILPTIVERELAVRVVHPDAKSWNRGPFDREELRLLQLHRGSLTLPERVRLVVPAAAKRLALWRSHVTVRGDGDGDGAEAAGG
jgi:glycosyltransferase involved in cell wall biosynthesis